jgi:hypothetical protein
VCEVHAYYGRIVECEALTDSAQVLVSELQAYFEQRYVYEPLKEMHKAYCVMKRHTLDTMKKVSD